MFRAGATRAIRGEKKVGSNTGVVGTGKPRGRKPRQTADTLSPDLGGDFTDMDTLQLRRLMDDYVPTNEEPARLRTQTDDRGISPIELRLRSMSHQPPVASVPDMDNSALLPGGKTALLSPCQEIILARRVENGDQGAKDIMVNSNMRLVNSIAQRYQNRGLPLEDLIQEGVIGLIRATDKYNWRRGFRFSTYATPWIRQTILRALANSGRSIRLPAYVVDNIARIARIRSELEGRLGRQPSRGELAQAAAMTEEQLTDLLQSMVEPASLDAPRGEEGDRSLADVIPSDEYASPSARVFRRAVQEEVVRALHSLTPREQDVLRLRFGLEGNEPHTLEEIGKSLHLTRERARQIELHALEKLRGNRAGQALRETLQAA